MTDYLEVRSSTRLEVFALEEGAVVVGRDPASQVALSDDPEVSRRHALIERLPVGWCVSDLSSHNGTRVNGDRIFGARALHDRDEVGIGSARIVFRAGVNAEAGETTRAADPPPVLTRREQDVLRELFNPARTATGAFTEPASTREIAQALVVTEAAVKQHLAHLYDKFGITEGDRRRVRLANEALRRGAVRLSELRASSG